MDGAILDGFERRVDSLLKRYIQLKRENNLLREKQAKILLENQALGKKRDKITQGIKKMIQRLKEVER
jgi:uncharacterized protein (TIGR02449 family)